MRRFFMLIPASMVLASCQGGTPTVPDAALTAMKAEVDAAAAAWWDAWAAVDYERGMAFFQDGAEATWTGDEGSLYRVAQMDSAWAGVWGAGWAKQQIDFTDSRTIILAPDVAYTIRHYDATVTDTAGNVLPTTSAVETLVWVKRDGDWKVLLGHESTLKKSWSTRLEMDSK